MSCSASTPQFTYIPGGMNGWEIGGSKGVVAVWLLYEVSRLYPSCTRSPDSCCLSLGPPPPHLSSGLLDKGKGPTCVFSTSTPMKVPLEPISLLQPPQPERDFKDLHRTRTHHERVPKELLSHTLFKCITQNEYLLNTRYYPRHDAVLLVLHYRSAPGRALWSRWRDYRSLCSARRLADMVGGLSAARPGWWTSW